MELRLTCKQDRWECDNVERRRIRSREKLMTQGRRKMESDKEWCVCVCVLG